MIEKYKEVLCRLAIRILTKYKVGHSEDLRRFDHIRVNGKFYAIDYIKVEKNAYGESLEIDAHDFKYYANANKKLND
jgi:hypothetical protein